MNKTPIVVVLLAAAVAVGFVAWSRDEAPDVPARDVTAGVAAPAEALAAEVAGELVTGEVETQPGELPAEEFLRTAVQDEAAASDRAVAVQVWQGEPGVPAAEADVFLLDALGERGLDWEGIKGEFAQHWSVVAEDQGRRYRTDAAGRVAVPRVRGGAIVAARAGGGYGFAWVAAKGEDTEVVLRPDETVTVRVVDGEGRPVADVPVGIVQWVPVRAERERLVAELRQLEDQMTTARRRLADDPALAERAAPRLQGLQNRLDQARQAVRRTGPLDDAGGRGGRGARTTQAQPEPEAERRADLRARRLSDERGLAAFRHFQLYRNEGEGWWQPEQRDRFAAVLLVPLQRGETREFAGRPVPEAVLELRLPATGSLELRTVDADGRPFVHPVRAALHLDDPDAAPWSRVEVQKPQGEAAIVFPRVGLGLRLLVDCRLDDEDFRWQQPAFAGPIEPGERRVVDLVVAPGEGMLCGRLVDGAGRAITGEPITFLITSAVGRLEGEEVLPGRDGRFHLPYLVRDQHRAPFALQIRRPRAAPVAGLLLELEQLPRDRVTDLGELCLDDLGVATQGFVVDDRGHPVAGALLQLQRERPLGAAGALAFVDEAFAVAKSDEVGRYALFGELERARYRLRVTAKNHFPAETRELRRGEATNVELLRRSSLIGTVLRPAWLPAKEVRVQVALAADPSQRREEVLQEKGRRTYFALDWLKPGVYDLALRTSQLPEPFLRIDGLVVEPGRMDVHPRLVDLDLGACLYRFEITAVDENGQPLQPRRPLLARVVRSDGVVSHVALLWQQGRVELVHTAPQVDVIAMAEGHAIAAATLAAGRSELRLLSIPPVEVQLGGLKALAGAVNVQVVLELLDAEDLPTAVESFDGASRRVAGVYGRARYTAALLGDDDVARIALLRAGRHKVILRFGAQQRIRPTMVELAPVDIRLPPGAGPQRVVAAYDLGPIQQAIAEAAQAIAQREQGGR